MSFVPNRRMEVPIEIRRHWFRSAIPTQIQISVIEMDSFLGVKNKDQIRNEGIQSGTRPQFIEGRTRPTPNSPEEFFFFPLRISR